MDEKKYQTLYELCLFEDVILGDIVYIENEKIYKKYQKYAE
jgi:hypothetical protein